MVLSMPWDIINPRMNGGNTSWLMGRRRSTGGEQEIYHAPTLGYDYHDVVMQIITWDRDDPFVIWC